MDAAGEPMTIDFSENREPYQLIRENTITVSGGLCAPIPPPYDLIYNETEIRPGYVAPKWRERTFRGRLRNFFAWDKDWGTHMWGGPPVRLRDVLPVFSAPRGAIKFFNPPRND